MDKRAAPALQTSRSEILRCITNALLIIVSTVVELSFDLFILTTRIEVVLALFDCIDCIKEQIHVEMTN